MGNKFQHEEPKEGQLTLGFVVHIVKLKEFKEMFPDAIIQGWVVDDGKDEEDGG